MTFAGCIRFLALGLVVALVLIGCADEAREDMAEQIQLEVWFGRQEFVPEDDFESFHAANPNIRVEPIVNVLENTPEDLIRNYATGTAPDIAQIFMTNLDGLVASGVLRDMAPYLAQWQAEDPELYDSIVDIGWKAATSGSGRYGMSAHATAIWHVWRTDWLAAAGVPIPETFDQTLEAARIIRDSGLLGDGEYPYAVAGADDITTQIAFNAYFMAMSGRFTETGIPIVDSDAGRYLVEFYQTLVREHLVHPESRSWGFGDIRSAFVDGKTGMFVMGANVFPAFVDSGMHYGQGDGEWVATAQPFRPGAQDGYRQYGNSFPYVVSATTKYPDAVLKVLMYLNRPEIAGEVADRYQPATNRAVMEDPVYQARHPWVAPLFHEWLSIEPAPINVRQADINHILIRMVQRAIEEPGADPARIVRDTQRELDEF